MSQNVNEPHLTGLTDQEVLTSRQQHGENLLTPPKRPSIWKLYLEKFQDPVIEYIGAKVTVEQKQYIRRLAAECGMTVSSYVLARAFNYRPKARLTARQEAVMETLIGCRSDLVNYTSALRGMNPEKRRQMFNSYPFMLEWLKELGRLAERVTDVLDKVRFSNRLPDGTRNGEDREDEP